MHMDQLILKLQPDTKAVFENYYIGENETLINEIDKCKKLTNKPIGVNLTFLPVVESPDYPGYIKAVIDGGVKIVETAGNNPSKWLPLLKENGIKVIHKCTTVRHALKAEGIG